MTTNMDSSGIANGGTGGQPEPSGAAPSNSAVDFGAALERIEKRLVEIERRDQSVKDKRIAGLQGDVDNFRAQFAELKELMAGGLSEAAALRLMSATQPAQTPIQSQPPVAGNPQGTGGSIDVMTVMRAMKLDANDPDVINALRNERDPIRLVAAFSTIADRKAQPQAPIPDGQLQPTSGTPAQNTTIDSITTELDALMKNPAQNMAKIRELRKQLTVAMQQ